MTTEQTVTMPKRKRRSLQFSLRTMMLMVLLSGCGLGWLGMKLRHAMEQQEAVKAIRIRQEIVTYDYELPLPWEDPFARRVPPGPSWVRGLLGDDYFAHVVLVGSPFRPFGKDVESKMTDDGLVYLQAFPHLRELYLPARPITDVGLVHLEGLAQLDTLNLNTTQITDAGLARLQGLTKLKWLFLKGTRVTDTGLVHLQGLTKLNWLDLKGTRVTDTGLVHLQGLTKLEHLCLEGTLVTDAGVAELEKALPSCKIAK